MKLSIRRQHKILNTLIDLSREYQDNTIYRPENFENNFTFVTTGELIEYLKILESENLIDVCHGDYPDNFNIYTLHITPTGLSYIPNVNYSNQKKWIGIYVAWALLNFIFIFIKGTYGGSNRYFFPFQADWSGGNTWDLEYYDFSEFLVYAILLPLIVFFIYKYKEKISKYIEKISKILNGGGSNLPDNM